MSVSVGQLVRRSFITRKGTTLRCLQDIPSKLTRNLKPTGKCSSSNSYWFFVASSLAKHANFSMKSSFNTHILHTVATIITLSYSNPHPNGHRICWPNLLRLRESTVIRSVLGAICKYATTENLNHLHMVLSLLFVWRVFAQPTQCSVQVSLVAQYSTVS